MPCTTEMTATWTRTGPSCRASQFGGLLTSATRRMLRLSGGATRPPGGSWRHGGSAATVCHQGSCALAGHCWPRERSSPGPPRQREGRRSRATAVAAPGRGRHSGREMAGTCRKRHWAQYGSMVPNTAHDDPRPALATSEDPSTKGHPGESPEVTTMQAAVQDRILTAVALSPEVSTIAVLKGCPRGADERDVQRAVQLMFAAHMLTGPPYTLTAEGRLDLASARRRCSEREERTS